SRIFTKVPLLSVPTTFPFGAVRTFNGVPVGSVTRQRSCAEASVNPTKQVATASTHEKDNDRHTSSSTTYDKLSVIEGSGNSLPSSLSRPGSKEGWDKMVPPYAISLSSCLLPFGPDCRLCLSRQSDFKADLLSSNSA